MRVSDLLVKMPEHPNIIIRPYTLDDVPAMYAAVRESIAEVAAWLSWCHAEYTEAEAREYIAARAEARATESEYGFAKYLTISSAVYENAFRGGAEKP